MVAERRFETASVDATLDLAAALGALLGPNSIVALDGELGAGKTTFTRGLAQGLEVTEQVSSPTYTLMHSYPGRLEVFHFDAWMEGREAAFLEGGGAEWLRAGGVSVIEWAERVEPWLPDERLEVWLEHRGGSGAEPWHEGRRGIRMVARGEAHGRALALLEPPAGVTEIHEKTPDET